MAILFVQLYTATVYVQYILDCIIQGATEKTPLLGKVIKAKLRVLKDIVVFIIIKKLLWLQVKVEHN